jgi:hypothetical protein
MSGDERRSAEQRQFERLTRLPHGRINPCFMTGKGCVHTETIDKEIEARAQAGDLTGFLIMPFQPNINVFFELCLRRYLSGDYQFGGGVLGLERADQIQRTGYVICEKICRRIQACDFIVADVSVPNPNVFYELGLAYGCRQKLLVVHHMAADPGRADETGTFGKQIVEYLAEGGCRPHAYRDLAPLTVDRFPLSERLWEYADGSPSGGALSSQIVLLAHPSPRARATYSSRLTPTPWRPSG